MTRTYEEITKECDAKIPRDVISTREGSNGRQLNYLEGWYVIDRLNKVFGQGHWAYTSEVTKTNENTLQTKFGEAYSVGYNARVRLVVSISNTPTEFTDYGHGIGTERANPGKAHESAIKEAITDGLKRCARALGNSFGNGLYDKSGEGIEEVVSEVAVVKEAVKTSTTPKPKETKNVRTITNTQIRNYRDIAKVKGGAPSEFFDVEVESLTDLKASQLLNDLKSFIEPKKEAQS